MADELDSMGGLPHKGKIIFLGETTHGSESIRSLKTCIIKKLINEQNFDSIVLEFDFLTIKLFNLQGDLSDISA